MGMFWRFFAKSNNGRLQQFITLHDSLNDFQFWRGTRNDTVEANLNKLLVSLQQLPSAIFIWASGRPKITWKNIECLQYCRAAGLYPNPSGYYIGYREV